MNETTVDLMHLVNEYGKNRNLRNEVVIQLVNDQLQMVEKDTYEIYQIYLTLWKTVAYLTRKP